MGRALGFIGVLLALAIGGYIYMQQTKAVSPSGATPKSTADVVGVKNDLLAIAQRYADSEISRQFAHLATEQFQPALHSCQFWWASRKPMWDVPMIHRGFQLLNAVALNAAKSIGEGSASERVKQEARWRMAAANEARTQIERELFGR